MDDKELVQTMNLTDEQIEAAAKAMYEGSNQGTMLPYGVPWNGMNFGERHRWLVALRAAAPFLQMPWEMPTAGEVEKALCANGTTEALLQFVRSRNASLIPKPVDPRREKVINILCHADRSPEPAIDANKLADRILAALDAKE